jgi:hypothetical protein
MTAPSLGTRYLGQAHAHESDSLVTDWAAWHIEPLHFGSQSGLTAAVALCSVWLKLSNEIECRCDAFVR